MSSLRPLAWGILSAGKISHDFTLALKTLPETEHQVVAVAARSLDSAQQFATTHSIPRFYGSYEELINDKGVDVIYVGAIHTVHLDVVPKILEARKPVLCEKPMTLKALDTKALIDKATEVDVFLMEGLWTRFFPAVNELCSKIAEGYIGDLKFIRADFSKRLPPERMNGSITSRELGGGALYRLGVYPIYLATMLFGERPEKTYAQGSFLSNGVDELTVITLTYSGGRIAQLTSSISYSMSCDAVICGTKGELQLPNPFWCPTKLETPRGVYPSNQLAMEFPLPETHFTTNYPYSIGLRYEAQEVYECLKEGKKQSDKLPLEHSLIVAEIVDEVFKQLGVIHE